MPPIQSCCEEQIRTRIVRFNKTRGVLAADPEVKKFLLDDIEYVFPGIFELLMHPERWVDLASIPSHFPIQIGKTRNVRFIFEVFMAPLPFAACCVKIPCSCGVHNRVIVLNSTFFIAISHLIATSAGHGYPPNQLAALLKDLHGDPRLLESYPPPMGPRPRHEITAGLAWLLFHECGHVVGGTYVSDKNQTGTAEARKLVTEELNADLASFMTLHHRCIANQCFRRDLLAVLLCGIEMVLRCIAALSSVDGRLRTLKEADKEPDYGHPSPMARWNRIQTIGRNIIQSPAWGSDDFKLYREKRALLFRNYNRAISAIRDS